MSGQIDGLRAFMAGRRAAPGRTAPHVTVVASGKGGVGTSTVASLLALAAARRGRETLLVDATGSPASLGVLVGAAVAPMAGDDDVLEPVAAGLTLGSPGVHRRPAGAGERHARYRRLAARYGEFDFVIVDAGCTLECALAATAGAGRLVAVTRGDRVALAATYALIKTVGERFPALPTGLLANGCTDHEAAVAFESVRAAAEHFLARPLGFCGGVPEDGALRHAVEAGGVLHLAGDGAAASATGFVVDATLRDIMARAGHPARTAPTLSLIRA